MGITAQIMREALEQAGRTAAPAGHYGCDDQQGERGKSQFVRGFTHSDSDGQDSRPDRPGGKVIRGIIDATGVKIDVDDTGRVNVASSDADGLAAAIQMISDITAVRRLADVSGKVVRIASLRVREIFPGTDGLLHVSEIANTASKK